MNEYKKMYNENEVLEKLNQNVEKLNNAAASGELTTEDEQQIGEINNRLRGVVNMEDPPISKPIRQLNIMSTHPEGEGEGEGGGRRRHRTRRRRRQSRRQKSRRSRRQKQSRRRR